MVTTSFVEFSEKLRDIGIDFKINVNPSDFHDYRECDAVLAVRDLTESDYNAKPASKLINAWHAGVPALLGPEPAFQALRRSELDYLEVRSPQAVLRAIIELRENPDRHHQMVLNGLARAQEFTVSRIASQWRDVLAGPVTDGFSSFGGRNCLFGGG